MISGVSLFIRSFDGDAKWLQRTLPKLVGHASGYHDMVVVGVPGESELVEEIALHNGVRFAPDGEAGLIEDGYINQQYSKMRADLFLPGSEHVVYVDSDCLAVGPHSPGLFFKDGKPLGMYSTWEHVGQAVCWRMPTRYALGIEPRYEYMRRLPAAYPTVVVKGAREHIEKVHGVSLLEFLTGRKAFSEFNVLGCYAHEQATELFTWICPERETYEHIPFRQFWSHGSIDDQLKDLA